MKNYYFAYGSNLLGDQMAERCPQSKAIATARLDGWQWLIGERGFATIRADHDAVTFGALYELSEQDERTLDRREGVATGSYGKFYLEVEIEDTNGNFETVNALVYIDPRSTEGAPSTAYIGRCIAGAYEWGLPTAAIDEMEQAERSALSVKRQSFGKLEPTRYGRGK